VDVRFVPSELSRIEALRYEAVALPFFEDERPLRGVAGLCDWRLCGRLSQLLDGGRVRGTLGEVTLLPTRPRLPFDKMLLVGCGTVDAFDEFRFGAVMTRMYEVAEGLRLRNLVLSLPGRSKARVSPGDAIRWFLDGTAQTTALDEVVVLDEPEAQKVMTPVVDAERRRARAAREVGDDA
jgi:hypothetical protein